ncbi:MAG: glycosyltransferase family 39 protein, partial [Anaerolineales bacterium]|nr:glycosyltransferase family 39 protein [Anaerolineales bacterium]
IIAGPLALAAFLAFGGNLFTNFNLALWILAITFFIWALWLREPQAESGWSRFKERVTSNEWQVTITRWSVLVFLAFALATFFRFYRLNGVPAEPFSDHAEKILDVYDITQGQTHIFFERNTGREGLQMYLTAAVAALFGSGLSFLSLKIGTVLAGLGILPYMYLLGKEIANRRVGLLAMLFAGIAYWPNVISRAGLRFPLYPLFVAPTLYYLIRGLRTSKRNDFILSGLFLGLGLHGYSPFRIVPFLILIAIGLYWLHTKSKVARRQAIIWLSILALTSLLVFLPLLRYALENSAGFSHRAFSRLGTIEAPLPDAWWKIFFSNLWNALRMFNWDDGQIWVVSVTGRPALDVVSGARFVIGIILLLVRYMRQRHWLDLFLLLSIPLLLLPSILSLAFPAENPALNRAGGALVPAFLIVALALEGLLAGFGGCPERSVARPGTSHRALAWAVTGILLIWSMSQNYDLVFKQYDR